MLPFLIELISGKARSSLPRRLPVILPSDSSGQESHHSSVITYHYHLLPAGELIKYCGGEHEAGLTLRLFHLIQERSKKGSLKN